MSTTLWYLFMVLRESRSPIIQYTIFSCSVWHPLCLCKNIKLMCSTQKHGYKYPRQRTQKQTKVRAAKMNSKRQMQDQKQRSKAATGEWSQNVLSPIHQCSVFAKQSSKAIWRAITGCTAVIMSKIFPLWTQCLHYKWCACRNSPVFLWLIGYLCTCV